jgi:hypothetical protein
MYNLMIKTSETLTVAALGPKLVAVMVKVTLVPTSGVVSDIVFYYLKFVCGTGVGVAVDVLFAGVGSL